MTKLTVFRGDDKVWNLNFTDADGVAYDITSATVFFTVKTNKTDADASALISKDVTSHSSPTDGETMITLTNSDTDIAVGTYYFDIQLVESGGTVTTCVEGQFVVKQDITVRTS